MELDASKDLGMLSNVSIKIFASAFSIVGFGTLNVKNTSEPSLFSSKNVLYFVSNFFTT